MKSNLNEPLKPFTKWTGGKRQLLHVLRKNIPEHFNTYYEPFIGGGSFFFDLAPKNAVINDLNSDLMLCYSVIKDEVVKLIEVLKQHEINNSKEYYLNIREADRDGRYEQMTNVEKAARLIYMLRVDFNGLYRVNSKGQFNVPYGKYKNPKILNKELLFKINEYLNSAHVIIKNEEFFKAVESVKKDDFVYFDPPYVPISDSSYFTSYTKDGFGVEEQKKLRDVFVELDSRGAFVMLSNSSHPFVHELYSKYKDTTLIVGANRMINSVASRRGKVEEVIIKNY
ncbi:DNA adenine methylase [Ignavigranum ruoffiae]|uniref:Site-specific DNA-methyltransferase (adenine-specific) n=1 Tax=Ignavigranum ruoffiae TaxID=89093 RepID=A0A1H9B428_9LACT|nr:DNA adenine methylase [Ignavigranum ruoffiae]SEP83782.1 DNA adenine methylase [Ignavigranum ruoffiae]